MVKVCKHCSNIQIESLQKVLTSADIEIGCIGHCEDYSDQVFGLINNHLVVCDDESQFIDIITSK